MAHSRLKSFPPLTVSREQLLTGKRDTEFRELVQNLLRFSTQIQAIRGGLAWRMGVTQPQYNIMLAIAHFSSALGTTIGEISQQLNVTEPFIVEETRKLVVAGLVEKRGNATDRRRVQIHLTKVGIELGQGNRSSTASRQRHVIWRIVTRGFQIIEQDYARAARMQSFRTEHCTRRFDIHSARTASIQAAASARSKTAPVNRKAR